MELATGVLDLVSASGYISVSSTTATDISTAYLNISNNAYIYLAVGETSNIIYLNCYGSLRSKDFCITIRYTKPAPAANTETRKKKTTKKEEE